ncbi:MAG: glycosyl hydrolase 108 family protein [Oryzomonas sp.]|uniref:glycoside hydrolase family 108 protein n=1 Tax=Oryzomonas sp. TaxID=2855186 RepID=UPI002845DE66|nr:glycosyl hydrolase 108 family protein [Oryzomonas sp.]MDR3578381.1 glycosyl hydrolase 108 family protein [Oryzomonas sp.]
MADFNAASRQVMGNEGGYSNNPADAGGETYKGIARKFWPQWGGWKFVDGVKANAVEPPASGTQAHQNYVAYLNRCLGGLTSLQQLVLDFYKRNFWDKYRLSEVNDQAVATWIYDHVVNGGGRGAMWIQEAVGVKADGAIGPQTIQAINAVDPKALLRDACDVAAFYRLDRASADLSQLQFLPSWLRRDGVSDEEIRQVMRAARDGLTYDKVTELKEMIQARA